jgi:hypothetical protein
MILEPKHKNLKGQNKIKQQVQQIFNIRRHMSILMAFEWYYFQAILYWWHSPFNMYLPIDKFFLQS